MWSGGGEGRIRRCVGFIGFHPPTFADFAITGAILSILSHCVSLEFVKVSRSVEIISLEKPTSQALVRQRIMIRKLQHFHGFFYSVICVKATFKIHILISS